VEGLESPKGHGLIDRAAPIFTEQTSWWAPRRRGWWLAVLFIVGSLCFAVGSFPPTAAILGAAAGPVFFLGSIFFTTAAYLQYYEASNEGDSVPCG